MNLSGVLVVILSYAIIFTSIAFGRENEDVFDAQKGHRLLNSEIENLIVNTAIDCTILCTKNSLCKSVNYNYQDSNSDVNHCYLSNKTKRSAPVEDFKDEPTFTYYEKDLCSSSPCWFGTCSKDNSNYGFLCNCRPGYKGSFCQTVRLGWFSRNPGKSCQEILLNGDAVHVGKYWIDPENAGNAMQVYCDMSNEGGGWLLVSNIVITDPANMPTLSLNSSYRVIANYTNNKTVISATALGQLHQFINFTQLRFQCQQAGRTLHLITAKNSTGYDVVKYFTASNDVLPQACYSFYRGTGDNSRLAAQCSQWTNGKWGRSTNEWRLYDHAFYIPHNYHWLTLTTLGRFECDARYKTPSNPGDYWKVYVR